MVADWTLGSYWGQLQRLTDKAAKQLESDVILCEHAETSRNSKPIIILGTYLSGYIYLKVGYQLSTFV